MNENELKELMQYIKSINNNIMFMTIFGISYYAHWFITTIIFKG